MIAEDVPDDEGLEDDVVAENMEGSLAMVDAEAVDDDAPVLGARRTLADIVNIVVNKLGFSIDGAERDNVVDSLIAHLTTKTMAYGDKVDKSDRSLRGQGVERTWLNCSSETGE
jgi:hypothetical protein